MPSKRTIPRACQWCGAAFLTWPQHARIGTGKFCSKSCSAFARHEANPSAPWEHILRIDDDSSCWVWTGRLNKGGYGALKSYRLGVAGAHRAIWTMTKGAIPDGLHVLHTCDNPPCVRNDDEGTYEVAGRLLPRIGHLFLGTDIDNVADKVRKHRQAFGEKIGGSILCESDVPKIRLLIQEKVPHIAIAATFGVSPAAIYAIASGETWRHVS